MSLTVRHAQLDDLDAAAAVAARVFSDTPDDADRARGRRSLETASTFVLEDGDLPVGVSANYRMEVTVPGGTATPMAGVTWVAVLPTHHRRGGLTAMMAQLLNDAREHEEALAGLWASESVIYRRFGFGIATRTAFSHVDTRHATLRPGHPEFQGQLTYVRPDEVPALLEPLHLELCQRQNGMVHRPRTLLEVDYMPAPRQWSAHPQNIVVHKSASGDVDGFMRYSIREEKTGPPWVSKSEVTVHDLVASTAGSELALWHHALGMDFTTTVHGNFRPVEEVIADLLVDPRRWRVDLMDALHLRILDTDRVLAGRRYLTEGSLVLEVVEPDGSHHRHRLEGGPEGAECRPSEETADISIDIASLGSLLLGDASAHRLHRAGLVEEHQPGAVARMTGMFLWAPLPWAGGVF